MNNIANANTQDIYRTSARTAILLCSIHTRAHLALITEICNFVNKSDLRLVDPVTTGFLPIHGFELIGDSLDTTTTPSFLENKGYISCSR